MTLVVAWSPERKYPFYFEKYLTENGAAFHLRLLIYTLAPVYPATIWRMKHARFV